MSQFTRSWCDRFYSDEPVHTELVWWMLLRWASSHGGGVITQMSQFTRHYRDFFTQMSQFTRFSVANTEPSWSCKRCQDRVIRHWGTSLSTLGSSETAVSSNTTLVSDTATGGPGDRGYKSFYYMRSVVGLPTMFFFWGSSSILFEEIVTQTGSITLGVEW